MTNIWKYAFVPKLYAWLTLVSIVITKSYHQPVPSDVRLQEYIVCVRLQNSWFTITFYYFRCGWLCSYHVIIYNLYEFICICPDNLKLMWTVPMTWWHQCLDLVVIWVLEVQSEGCWHRSLVIIPLVVCH